MREALGKSYRHMSATMAPTVVEGRHQELISIQLYMQNLQATLEMLLKLMEERITKPDPHLLAVQKATIELVQRDMVQMSRPTAWLIGTALAILTVCNVILFLVFGVFLATNAPDLPPPAPRTTSVQVQEVR